MEEREKKSADFVLFYTIPTDPYCINSLCSAVDDHRGDHTITVAQIIPKQ